ncbi:olfactory receptor 14A16-like [Tenrec ecaudatus]|uniref:olfactory receptor 14A16-like n=1 Tax=Tenrec ecaudatus TaxID=94439 RepID=UPI003F591569
MEVRKRRIMVNLTLSVNGFILMGFSDIRDCQIFNAILFFLIYLLALLGNLTIIILTTSDQHLNSPMYFFLKTLSLLDLCFISVTLPKAIFHSLTQNGTISFLGCVAQVFFVVLFACGSNFVHQFFCEIPSLLKLSCSEKYLAEIGAIIVTTSLGFVCFISIMVSYIHIFSAVLRIASVESRSKAFSTCIPHLVVVTVFTITGSVAYMKPVSEVPSVWDLLVSVFYTVVPPTINPIIYSLKNKDMKTAFRTILRKIIMVQ